MIYIDEVLADTPTVYYEHEEASGTTMTDASGSGLDGTYTAGGLTYERPGPLVDRVSLGVAFDGAAGRFTSATLTGANRPSYPFCIECWVRPASATPTQGKVAFGVIDHEQGDLARIEVGAGNLWSARVSGPVNTATITAGAITGGCQHIVLRVVSATERRLYVDGVLVGSEVATSVTWSGTKTSYTLHGGWDAGAAHFATTLSRSALYNADLAAARIAAHYRAGVLSPVYQAISEALKADATLLAATAGRIFADQFPDDGVMPGVRYALLTDTPHNRLTSGASFTGELQLDAYADRGDENRAWDIADAARLKLERATLKATGFSQIKTLTTQRPLPMREGALSRVHSRYRLFGSAA